ncbi:hypothetical protein FHETE_7234 [Fusarium heterosporum]|uniref:Uncharacterized protein n=1 Tax=Fusarium heterosporum TaxID=42747 RepID=A0A8H5T7M4_FUSHE|nr:hypothetical protein FHETE_7234 [Fusarium heterosporum]
MEAVLNDKKQQFAAAIQNAQQVKESAQKAYDEEKEAGLTNDGFVQWVIQNYPQLSAVYNNYQATQAEYTQIFMQVDSAAAQSWLEERRNKQMEDTWTDDEYEKKGYKQFQILSLDNEIE